MTHFFNPCFPLQAEPIRVVVTGAAGQIAYSLLYSIAKGDVFGKDQVRLHNLQQSPFPPWELHRLCGACYIMSFSSWIKQGLMWGSHLLSWDRNSEISYLNNTIWIFSEMYIFTPAQLYCTFPSHRISWLAQRRRLDKDQTWLVIWNFVIFSRGFF